MNKCIRCVIQKIKDSLRNSKQKITRKGKTVRQGSKYYNLCIIPVSDRISGGIFFTTEGFSRVISLTVQNIFIEFAYKSNFKILYCRKKG